MALVEAVARAGKRSAVERVRRTDRRAACAARSPGRRSAGRARGRSRRRRVQTLGGELLRALRLELARRSLSACSASTSASGCELGADVVVHHVGAEQPERRERARPRRHQDAPHAELVGDRRRMHRAGAAERQQREGRRDRRRAWPRTPAPRRPCACRRCGGCRRRLRARSCSSGSAMWRSSAACGGCGIELLRAAEEIVRIEEAADEVGVGDGRLRCRRGRSRPGPDRRRRSSGRR